MPISYEPQRGEGGITMYYKNIPHHLLNIASPKKIFTVAQYQRQAQRIIADIWQRSKLPIICGGTGFYIDTVIYNYKLPPVLPNNKFRQKLEKQSVETLFNKLKSLDPHRAASIDQFNKRRLIRALEINLKTGQPITPLNYHKKAEHVLYLALQVSPEKLKQKIKKRLKERLNEGLIEEVKNLHNKTKLSWERLDNFGLEYRYVARYLRGQITEEEMIKVLEKEIWRYAKRQLTWFKRNSQIHWIKNFREAKKLVTKFLK